MRASRTLFKLIGITLGVLIGGLLLGAGIFVARCGSAQPNFQPVRETIPPERATAEKEIAGYTRTEETTYLTLPEWYLVFNPQAYARFIGQERPSAFPYFASIGQAWYGYCQVYGITQKHYSFNAKNHLTEGVIVTSFTGEYLIKGFYENTIGRLAEWSASGARTQEDDYAAKVAEEYGAFVPDWPWYQFPFREKLVGLWQNTDLFGPHLIRKFERKLFLSAEYGTKAAYAYVIRAATHSIYGVADSEIYAYANNVSLPVFDTPGVHEIKSLGGQAFLIAVPHYQGFTDTVPELARRGVQFEDIAGNDEILLTAIAPSGWRYDLREGSMLFAMPDLTNPGFQRLAIQAPVRSLSNILNALAAEGVRLEHLYDY